ncbi:16S/23S rRNA (cytidine-2'-O)-methyltransferase TlyA [Pannonibacter phragmitetus]|uniref:16S/23S rRNA (Cytidine-2'-O)-methyltransferase TlyA n=1 Tax=Pannonibacter phragmitetus TaxID=121719 RepID=A0A378ZSL9_9HYPH|nr:TlyA family RNA methyltransferase [Pannonibacter phragmitetus]SUA99993.1 16S/23S rRNA (cytidine-2'-O)-methyltransferase TlyA [Pannonibacter phragmitetus]
MSSRQRLDQCLADLGLAPSRARARDAILRGTVSVDGVVITKPGQLVSPAQKITLADPAQNYVSRAALKLLAALDAFPVDPAGKTCLDAGASTGGFTQVLLERGAARVHAIDVGHGQLHERIASNPKVNRRDGLNARDLTLADLEGEAPQLIVSDVSFISLKLALPPALELAPPGAETILLVKPQFEVGRQGIGKGGLVQPDLVEPCAEDLRLWLDALPGWKSHGLIPSPVTGGDGNREFLLYGRKDG